VVLLAFHFKVDGYPRLVFALNLSITSRDSFRGEPFTSRAKQSNFFVYLVSDLDL